MTKVGWTPYKNLDNLISKYDNEIVELLYFEPEKIDVYKETQSTFKMCPAVNNHVNKFWVIKSPCDLTLNYDRNKKICNINQNQAFYNAFVHFRFDEFKDTDYAVCSIMFMYMFVADEPVWMEVYPAFMHENSVENIRVVPGGFDIYNWQRPIDFTFEILDDTKPVEIKRGQPLFYVKFNSKKINDDFKLQRIQWTEELAKLTKMCLVNSYVKGISWYLHKIGNKLRPKKLVK